MTTEELKNLKKELAVLGDMIKIESTATELARKNMISSHNLGIEAGNRLNNIIQFAKNLGFAWAKFELVKLALEERKEKA